LTSLAFGSLRALASRALADTPGYRVASEVTIGSLRESAPILGY